MITAITPTGDRPLALLMCQQWMERQTMPPDQWIVVDDGKEPYRPGVCGYIRRRPQPDDPKHTLNINMLEALRHVKGDKIIIIEDDEYYAPGYIEEMSRRLDTYALVGIGWSKYYHLPSRGYARHANIAHASWAQTAFRAEMIPLVAGTVGQVNQDYMDVRVWRACGGGIVAGRDKTGWCRAVGDRACVFDDGDTPLYVGMKGLLGRPGIGIGHRAQTYKTFDTDGSILKSWIPDAQDRAVYEEIMK